MDLKDVHSEQTLLEKKEKLLALLLAEQGLGDSSKQPRPQVRPVERGNRIPLAFEQEQLWFLSQLEPDSSFYHIPLALYLDGPLDVAALQASLQALVARHEILRTCFQAQDGSPFQVILPHLPLSLPFLDLSELSADRPAQVLELEAVSREEAERPFDLEQAPLLRVRLVRLAAERHCLLLTLHHLIFDGGSLEILLRDLTQSYRAYLSGQSTELSPLPVQYADYAYWEREWLQGEVLQQELASWQSHLADVPFSLELPTDYPRLSPLSLRGASLPFTLSSPLVTRLRAFAHQEQTTLYTLLLAGLEMVIQRYSGQDDFLLATPMSMRTQLETESLLGMMVNTLLIRSDGTGRPHGRTLIQRVRERMLWVQTHAELPLEKLVEVLRPQRQGGATPLVQAAFAWEEFPHQAHMLTPRLGLRVGSWISRTAKFELTFFAWEAAESIAGQVEYTTDLYEATTIRRLVTHWQQVLESLVTTPEQPIDCLPMITSKEWERQVHTWNQTERKPLRWESVHSLIETQVELHPSAIAVYHDGQTLTYQDLNSRANQLAHYLRQQEIGVEDRIGICMPRSLDLIVSLLAILKVGAAYVPLDPTYPMERLIYILDDTRARLVLTQQPLRSGLSEITLPLLCFDTLAQTLAHQPVTNLAGPITANNLAYVMYTSGSTGQPKGIAITHGAITNLAWQPDGMQVSSADVFFHHSSISFDGPTMEIWGSLLNGALLVVAPAEQLSLAEMADLIQHHQVSVLLMTTSLFHQMVDLHLDDLQSLKYFLAGGETLSPLQAHRAAAGLPNCRVMNCYGPTETTTYSSCYFLPAETSPDASVPIGKPIAHTQFYVLDQYLQPVPVGVSGEIYLGGAGLARGYLHRPDLTAERFVPNPFSQVPGARLYRTGDRGYVRADGVLFCVGRSDGQVKLRGFRIEYGEIEHWLGQHCAVQLATVMLREDRPGHKRLVAYLVRSTDENNAEPVTAEVLRAYLQSHIPDYMLPSTFVWLEKLPLTIRGKVDRSALPAPAWDEEAELTEEQQPQTATEQVLAQIWADVLGISQISRQANFFEIGGHSLLAIQLISRVRTRLQLDVPLRTLFEAQTLASFAERIEATRSSAQKQASTPLRAVPRQGNLPLSFAQERLWFLARLIPENTAYNLPLAFRLQGRLRVEILRQSFNEIIRRHESLRTTFVEVQGQPAQIIGPAFPLNLPIVDLEIIPEREREVTIRQLANEEAWMPFSLEKGPLLRVTLLRLGAEEHILLLTIHHIIADNWSTNVLLKELATLYTTFSTEHISPLADLPLQYADYAVWQRDWLRGEALEAQLAYWKQQLADSPVTSTLPTDYPRPASPTFRGALQSLVVSNTLTEHLKILSQERGGTLFMALLAAFSLLLARYSGQDDFLVGTPIAGRTRPETERLIGLFLNTLVLRVNIAGNLSFLELLNQVREATLGAYAHQDLPFEQLVKELQPERDLNRNPLFEIMLNMTDLSQTTLDFSQLTLNALELIEPEAKLPLTLYAGEKAGELSLHLVYQQDLFSEKRMHLFLRQFQYLLEQIVASPEKSIQSYSLVIPEIRGLLPDPAEELTTPYYEPITNMVISWAKRMPEQPALCQASQQWSYSTLVKRAKTIAQTLMISGIKSGDVVAVLGKRSFGLIAALAGILMSGAVLLTLDSELPERRQHMMLQQADAKHLLCINDGRVEDPGQELFSLPVATVGAQNGLIVDAATSVAQLAPQLPTLRPDDPAYLFFTSGTSGVPKGVLGSHKGLSHFLTWQRATFELAPGDRSAQLTGLSFDVVLRDIFLPLISGATLYLPEKELELLPAQIIPWLAQERITTLHIVPTLSLAWLNDAPPKVVLPALRRVFFAGEPLTDTLVHRWRQTFGAAGEIVNLYGPTETTLAKCYYRVPQDVLSGIQPIGWPLPETQVLVLNKDHRLCAPGEPGEIAIRTPFRTLGYINAPQESWRFAKNPWRDDEQDTLYYSGDLGRYGLDGKLEILGRLDQQVKLRGIRIELREIEHALLQHPALQSAVVLLHKERLSRANHAGQSGGGHLLAYIVPASQQNMPTEAELWRFLHEWLPAYMIPSAFITLSSLPLTPNGKLDYRALPLPEHIFQGSGPYIAPRTPTEELVAGIWAQVLQQEAIGVHDNFFALGGHSLLGVQITSRLRNTFQVELPLRVLFEAPTVESLASQVESVLSAGQMLSVLPITQAERGAEIPLSFTQQRLWFLDQWEPDNPFFNISRALALHSPLVIEALTWSLNEIIRRHEALRTTIVASRGRPQQIIAPQLQVVPRVIELDSIPPEEWAEEVQRLARNEAQRPFHLNHAPLIRAVLLRLDETEHVLLLTLHHIISDAWSLNMLLQELKVHYESFLEFFGEQRSPLPELPIQYADFAIWQQARLQSRLNDTHARQEGTTLQEQQLIYWREHLRGAPPLLALPGDRLHPPKQTFRGTSYHFTLPLTLASDLKALSKSEEVTLFMTLLAAFQTLLFRYTEQEDLVIGSTNANRTVMEIENLIGCFFDIQALRTDLSGDPTFRELLGRVREVTLGAYAHQDLPFGKIVEMLQPERSLSHPPFFQVAFALQHIPSTTLTFADLTLDWLDIDTGTARLDLMLFLGVTEQGLKGIIEYNTDLFERSTIEQLVEHYQHLLEGIVAQPTQRLTALPLLSPAERTQLLEDWSATALASPHNQHLRQILLDQLAYHTRGVEISEHDIQHWRVYLLDASLQPVPVSVVGDLYIHLPSTSAFIRELNAEQVIPHPFENGTGARLYPTGLLARYRSGGVIEYLGRQDQQVDVRGYRIRLHTIESLVIQHPTVRECLVLPCEAPSGEQQLVAYIVPTHEKRLLPPELEQELRRFVAQHLPDYLVPMHFVFLDAWPLAPNGQPDQQALLAMPWEQDLSSAIATVASTETEAALIEIWNSLLDPDEVLSETNGTGISIHDDFFALGGHSLLATQVMSRVHEHFQVELPLPVFFTASTIAELAAEIEAARQNEREQLPPLVPVPRTGTLPLSFAQERLWFLEQLASDGTAYTMMSARRIRGYLDISALEQSLAALVERHEVLRTTYKMGADGPLQIIAAFPTVPLPVHDLAVLPATERQAAVQRIATAESATPFALSQGPLLRAQLLRLDEQQHVLLIAIHHIASDGWSQGIMYRELEMLYTAYCQGQPASLPTLPIQYADYAVWQRTWLQGSVLEAQVAYWREQLAGVPAVLDLPTDHSRPAVQHYSGAIYDFSLPVALAEQVRALSQQEGTTLFMTLLAAFQTLLYRYSGQEDFTVGTPIANRTQVETEKLIGFFVNTLVLRANLAGDPSFLQLLGHVRETCLGAYAHQALPFEKLVEKLQPERSLSYNPLFQVFFALQNMVQVGLNLPDAIVEPLMVEAPTSKFDLSFYLAEGQEGELHGVVEYCTDLFEKSTIARLAGLYQQLLEGIVTDPTRRLSQLSLLNAEDWEQIIWQWNATEMDYPQHTCLPQLFEEQTTRTPEASALIFEGQQITYKDLDARTNQLANYLRKLGVGPDVRVGICLEPSIELIVSILAILKAGGAYLPLDPRYPVERLTFMVQDAGAPLVLTRAHFRSLFTQEAAHVLFLDIDASQELIAHQTVSAPNIKIDPDNLAYIIYTSGSTGRPKGVMGTHRATINRLHWMWKAYPFATHEVCCQKTSLSFVDAVWEIFGPLLQGIPNVLIPTEQIQKPHEFINILASHSITRLVLVPSLLQTLLDLDHHLLGRLSNLKYWIVSGEALSLELLQRFQQCLPTSTLLNLYGSSEVAADATCHEVPALAAIATGVTIGHPIANTQVYILDQHLRPVSIGMSGELYIGGVGVARGYLDRPDLTAERFIPHPFSQEPGQRLYKTGDQGHYLPTGEIAFLRRTDYQAKVRGFRIEAGEVEASLNLHPLIRETLVLVREEIPGEKRLVAYVITQPGQDVPSQELRNHLLQRLPEYMIPTAFVFLEAFPLTPNGKVNRRMLPPPQLNRTALASVASGPRTGAEEALVAIWAAVLHLEQVGLDENFFELGGDSILTMQVVIRALRVGLKLSPKQLFQFQTITELARAIENDDQKIPIAQLKEGQSTQPPLMAGPIESQTSSYTPANFPLANLDEQEFKKLTHLLRKKARTKESPQ